MGDDWNEFMQSKPVRIAFDCLCAAICGFYAVGAVIDLVRPNETAQMLIESVGTMGFYALTVARGVVCVWVSITFVRQTLKLLRNDE